MKKVIKSRNIALALIIVTLCVIVSIISPAFMQWINLTNILNNSIPTLIIACGMTIVIITGGIEISVAAEMVFCSFIVGTVSKLESGNMIFVVMVALAIGAVLGMINGVIIAYLKVPPIIATLGTYNVFRGGLLYFTSGKWIMNLPVWLTDLTRSKTLGFPASIYIVLLVVVVTILMLKYTAFGRSIYAIGGNREAALRAGINIPRTLFWVYVYAGVMCGIAGLVNAARLGNIQPNGSVNLEMTIVAAVIMGGTNILGGSGTIVGTVLGVIMMTVADNVLILLYVPTYWQKFVIGAILISIITINVVQRMMAEKNKVRIDVDEELRKLEAENK